MIIITQDQDFLRLNASGEPNAGIAYCKKDSKSIGEMISSLGRMWELLEPETMANRVQFLRRESPTLPRSP